MTSNLPQESPTGYRFHKQVWLSAMAESAAQLTTAERTKA
jgi:hypothetical protein